MNSYRVLYLISVTVIMVQFTLSRELLLLNTSPNSQHVVNIYPFPYLTHYNCRYYQPIVCSDVNRYDQPPPANERTQSKPSPGARYNIYSHRDAIQQNTHEALRFQIHHLEDKDNKNKNNEIKPQLYKNNRVQLNSLKSEIIFDKNMIPYRLKQNELDNRHEVLNKPASGNEDNVKTHFFSMPDKDTVHSKVKEVSIINQTASPSGNMDKLLTYQTEPIKNCSAISKKLVKADEMFYNSNAYPLSSDVVPLNDEVLYEKFKRNVDELERKFYQVSFDKLSANSPSGRQENGISFAQSGLFLHFVLMVLSAGADSETKAEIEKCLNFNATDEERKILIQHVLSSMPFSGDELKFRWSSRLVLEHDIKLNNYFNVIGETMQLKIDILNGTENPEQITNFLNNLVELDSGGAMHNTFDEDELSSGVSAVMISMLYIRGRWRSAPTLLNGTSIFRDAGTRTERTFGAIRINDIMRYADFNEWDAEAIEISYATPGLTLLLLVPRDTSLRRLTQLVTATSVDTILRRMHSLRAAITLPLYTLRMTLLLPSKLEGLGVTKLLDTRTKNENLKLSHAIQRIMFWSEAGRHAFKDDGIEWDDAPELELVVDRPYIFFVRWNDLTLLTGNFVL